MGPAARGARRVGRYDASLLDAVAKGFVAEVALDDAVAVLSDGQLRLVPFVPDDRGTDRLLLAPDSFDGTLVQVKCARAVRQDRNAVEFRVDAAALPRDLSRVVVLCLRLLDAPPWLGPEFLAIPAAELVKGRERARDIAITMPLQPRRRTRWGHCRHTLTDLPDVLAPWLERARPPRPSGARPRRPLYLRPPHPLRGRGLSLVARGRIFENQLVLLALVQSFGSIHGWRPSLDDAGEDLVFRRPGGTVSITMQAKGSFGPGTRGETNVVLRSETFAVSPLNYVAVVDYRPELLSPGPFFWLIRSDEITKRVTPRGGDYHLSFSANPVEGRPHQWDEWRYPTSEFAQAVGALLDGRQARGQEAVLPSRRAGVLAMARRLG